MKLKSQVQVSNYVPWYDMEFAAIHVAIQAYLNILQTKRLMGSDLAFS